MPTSWALVPRSPPRNPVRTPAMATALGRALGRASSGPSDLGPWKRQRGLSLGFRAPSQGPRPWAEEGVGPSLDPVTSRARKEGRHPPAPATQPPVPPAKIIKHRCVKPGPGSVIIFRISAARGAFFTKNQRKGPILRPIRGQTWFCTATGVGVHFLGP